MNFSGYAWGGGATEMLPAEHELGLQGSTQQRSLLCEQRGVVSDSTGHSGES